VVITDFVTFFTNCAMPFDPSTLHSLEASAATAAAYLDACDSSSGDGRLDAEHYQACGDLLMKIFLLVDAEKVFPALLERSPAAREAVDSIRLQRRIEGARLSF
jgi:hypothetical protein